MSKNETQFWIKQKWNVKFSDTSPERVVEDILNDYGYIFDKQFPIRASDDTTLTVDFRIVFPPPHNKSIVIEVDGIHHRTKHQENKTKWRDSLLTNCGYRVCHVDSRLTINQPMRDYLRTKLGEAIRSDEVVVRIDA